MFEQGAFVAHSIPNSPEIGKGHKHAIRVGDRFGRLTAIGAGDHVGDTAKTRHLQILCRCDCGTEKQVPRSSLITGDAKSCGCVRKEVTHNLTNIGGPRSPKRRRGMGWTHG